MTELVPPEKHEATHHIDPSEYTAEVYRLLACVLASPAIAANHDGSPTSRWFGLGWQKAEISRLLVHVATYFRVKADSDMWGHASWMHTDFQVTGVLYPDTTVPAVTVPLELREACNKIIHATAIHFDGTPDIGDKRGALNPLVHLYGHLGKKQWKAELNLVEFCRAALNVVF